jgi:hypothetical protein
VLKFDHRWFGSFSPEITQPDDAGVSLDKNLSGPGSLAH